MATVSGIFPDGEAALRAAEEVRERVSKRATVRVILPGRNGNLLEVSVLTDASGSLAVFLVGAGLGILGLALALALGHDWRFGMTALAAGVLAGILLAVWLTGERYPSRMVRSPDATERHQQLARGQAVVTAVVAPSEIEGVREAMLDEGGEIYEGFVHNGPPLPHPT
jgi:hypothetical protein